MANKKSCVVDLLPDDIKEAVDTQLAKGIPAPAIAKWLVARGHKVTARQIYGYKANTVPKATLTTPVDPDSYDDYSDSDKLKRLTKISLSVVDNLNDSFNATGDLSTARVLREMVETASGLLKYQLQYNQPDPVTHVTFQIGSLEESLGIPEATEDNWAHYGNNGGNLPHD
ncbi:hypothetical protein [Nostoc punctiforme]|uniref:Uncharacterized protein n=1 Tax=Nostoc punctiforme (strain ATCC 29133 / PCC 73102) TaxID=63737 RepID=B2IT04_NOSP7|nr:hypothetical protein [Nostoc punctiforme]ACC79502.1 hypothetical protein Npun_F0750 [Nostoc punctiforme PCC 73102]